MSHRKAYSQGSIPFSWEHKPGISKATLQECSSNIGLYALNITPTLPSCHSKSIPEVLIQDMKIPLPPCRPSQPQRKSTSKKGLSRQDDPFLAAYMECIKGGENDRKLPAGERKKAVNVVASVRKSKFNFSCIQSCEVRDDNMVRLTHLPPLPRERSWRVK